MHRAERVFVAVNATVVIGCLAAMALIVGANIALRYTTNHSLSWSDEAARYLMIWMTFLGAGLALRTGGHVAISNLQDLVSSRKQMILRSVILLILLVFFAYMVQVGWEYMQRSQYQKTPALRLSFQYIYAAMPVGFALMIVHLLLMARAFITAGTYRGIDGSADAQPGAANG